MITQLKGSRFVVLSLAGLDKGQRQLETRLGQLTADWWRSATDGLILCCERPHFAAASDGIALCLGPRRVLETTAGRSHDAAMALGLVRKQGPNVPLYLAPPFSMAWTDGGDAYACTDRYGIGQLFSADAEGAVAVSNSATLLARLFTCPLNKQALTGFALFGAFQQNDTPFAGVAMVPPGQLIRLAAGRFEPVDLAQDRPHVSAAEASGAGRLAAITRDVMVGLSDAAPGADLELSGGLDSRIMLAALPADRRRRHRAMTIGVPGSPDVRIAGEIASGLGMKHDVIDIGAVIPDDADELEEILDLAAEAYDYAANPIDKAALVMVNRHFASGARFSGQNGEILRGFYYPGQPLDAVPSETLARSLIASRLEANEFVDPALFLCDAYEARRDIAEDRAVERILSFDATWADSLDMFYLYERMRRWVGNATGSMLSDRAILYPFFDSRFVDAALSLDPKRKANSRAAMALLCELDPRLAGVPLDSGMRPSVMAGSPLRARLAEATHVATKIASRISRKLRGGQHATLGSAQISALWHRQGLYRRLPHDRLAATGILNEAALARLVSGQWTPDRPTLGFVLMLSGIVRATN